MLESGRDTYSITNSVPPQFLSRPAEKQNCHVLRVAMILLLMHFNFSITFYQRSFKFVLFLTENKQLCCLNTNLHKVFLINAQYLVIQIKGRTLKIFKSGINILFPSISESKFLLSVDHGVVSCTLKSLNQAFREIMDPNAVSYQ